MPLSPSPTPTPASPPPPPPQKKKQQKKQTLEADELPLDQRGGFRHCTNITAEGEAVCVFYRRVQTLDQHHSRRGRLCLLHVVSDTGPTSQHKERSPVSSTCGFKDWTNIPAQREAVCVFYRRVQTLDQHHSTRRGRVLQAGSDTGPTSQHKERPCSTGGFRHWTNITAGEAVCVFYRRF